MKKKCVLTVFFLLFVLSWGRANDPVLAIMTEEMKRNYEVLSRQPDPAYYLGYRMNEAQGYSKSYSDGGLSFESTPDQIFRSLSVDMRVGSYQMDNFREIRARKSYDYNSSYQNYYLSQEFDPYQWKLRFWRATQEIYQKRINDFSKVKAEQGIATAAEDKSNDFSKEERATYYEPAVDISRYKGDFEQMEKRVRPLFKILKDNRDLITTNVEYSIKLNRSYFVDNEGAAIAQNSLLFQISVVAFAMAEDGMQLNLYQTYRGNSLQDMPSEEQLWDDVRTMSRNLTALKNAPIADTYAGPAILSAAVTGVFFHEFFGHRVEGARLKQESDAQTFKKMLGQQVLPKDLSVTYDPQLKYFEGMPLVGNYLFDDEGVRGQRVEVVKNGILSNFLMNRRPIDGSPRSNGHGRGMIYLPTVARQSNMLISSNAPQTEAELRKGLIAELKKQNKPYGYHFKQVSGGSTITGRSIANAFNVYPLLVYRVWADGSKPDELVRGVNLIGTPLSVFSQIIISGNDFSVFNGYCGAESGSVLVSAVSPSMLLRQIETQRSFKNSVIPPLLSRP